MLTATECCRPATRYRAGWTCEAHATAYGRDPGNFDAGSCREPAHGATCEVTAYPWGDVHSASPRSSTTYHVLSMSTAAAVTEAKQWTAGIFHEYPSPGYGTILLEKRTAPCGAIYMRVQRFNSCD